MSQEAAATTADIIRLPTPLSAALARIERTGVLLERPTQVTAPYHPWVYALRGGRVGRCALDRYTLPVFVRDTTLVLPSSVQEGTLKVLPFVAELLDRIVPWVAVHVVPNIQQLDQGQDFSKDRHRHYVVGDRVYTGAGGIACQDEDFILLSADSSSVYLVTSAAHEAMHMCSHHFTPEVRRVLARAASNGHRWQDGYYDDVEERVCRMFENWVSAHVEGLPGHAISATEPSVALVFTLVWSGDFANELILHGEVPGAEQLRRRRGLRPLPRPPGPSLLDRARAWLTARARPLFA